MLRMTVSGRGACRALGQHRSTPRKVPRGRDDEEALTADLIALAERYGRYGCRKMSALLKAAGWFVNDKGELPHLHRCGVEWCGGVGHP